MKILLMGLLALSTVLAFANESLYKAVNDEDIISVQRILKEDPTVDFNFIDENNSRIMMSAVGTSNIEILEMLLKAGGNPNERNFLEYTPIMYIMTHGKGPELATLLVQYGADVNALNELGRTALHSAAEYSDSIPTLKVLLDLGAEVDLTEGITGTPLMAQIHQYSNDYDAQVMELFISRGANIEYRGFWGNTPLLKAAEDGFLAGAQVMIKAGANVNAVGGDGRTALEIAAENGNTAIVKILKSAGAK